MNRRILPAVATAAVVAVGLVACGIPEQTKVQVDGGSAAPGPGSYVGGGKEPPERTASGDDVAQFALNFLQAAAGEATGAYERVSSYVAPSGRRDLSKKQGQEVAINVVRLIEESPSITADPDDGTSKVTISVQQVGQLRANGALEPPVEKDSKYTFVVGKLPGAGGGRADESKGLWVIKPPPVLLMSTKALQDFYWQRTIYFWSKDDAPALVPDLRYLPVALPPTGQATEMVRWLVGGPSGWLQATAAGLPPGTKTLGNVFQSDGRLVVNLSVDSPLTDKDAEFDRLGTQLVWSLRETNLGTTLELTIKDQGNKIFDVNHHRDAHPAYLVELRPQRFCVYAGAVRRLISPGEASSEPVPIADQHNHNIVSAAITRDSGPVSAALVTTSGRSLRLLVGSGAGAVSTFKRSGRTYDTMGRPVWLKNPGSSVPVGLVVADRQLYRFGLNAELTKVDLPGAAADVTAVGAALDGRRIAYVAGDRLYVAPLAIDGTSVEVGQARQVPTTSLRDLTAVEWLAENTLVAAGKEANGRVALYDVTVDGGKETLRVDNLGTATVTHITAYPNNPIPGSGPAAAMYEAAQVAWEGSPPRQIDADQVENAGASPPPPAGAKPTAPFFLY